ncbi:MAG: hypothetical protein C0483_23090 [Pirellula sp.]|nr:hypothetical protein [Pirellula sp.]
MATTLEEFGRSVLASGLLAGSELKSIWAEIPSDSRPHTSDEFAEHLVAAGKLNRYQANELLRGRKSPLVLGDYTIVERIGAGGMGQVFKAHHRRLDKIVALKILADHMTQDQDAVKRFQREVRAAGKVVHPNIVAAHDAGESRGVHYLVMEYIDGRNLGDLVIKKGPLSMKQAVACIVQAARGLEYAHQCGLIHRDVKPSNLFIDKQGTVKILDLGLARIDDALGGGADEHLTGTGNIMGTVDFMSPEQAFDSKHVDARTDIYSLGCTLYYLVNGRRPFDGDTLMKRLLAHREGAIPPLIPSKQGAASEFDVIFRRMVAKRPEDRFASMSELVAALQVTVSAFDFSKLSSAQPGPVMSVEIADSHETPNRIAGDTDDVSPAASIVIGDTASGRFPNFVTETHLPRPTVRLPTSKSLNPSRKRLVAGLGVSVLLALPLLWGVSLFLNGDDAAQSPNPAAASAAASFRAPNSTVPAGAGRTVPSRAPGTFPLLHQEILETLGGPLKSTWQDMSYGELAMQLRKEYGINTFVDVSALSADGVSATDSTVNWTNPKGTLEFALGMALKPRGLTALVHGDVLWITSRTRAEREPFDIQAFIVEPPVADERRGEFIEMIETVEADSWRSNGGVGGDLVLGKGILLTRTSYATNREIARRFRSVLRQVELTADVVPLPPDIAQAMRTPVTLKLNEVHLADAVKEIEQQCNLSISIDADELSRDGKGTETICSLDLDSLQLSQALELLLLQNALDYKLVNDMLVVTTKADAEATRYPLEYDASDLNRYFEGLHPIRPSAKSTRVISGTECSRTAMEWLVAPSEWADAGAFGIAKFLPDGKTMVIDQSTPVHRELQRMFSLLRSAAN